MKVSAQEPKQPQQHVSPDITTLSASPLAASHALRPGMNSRPALGNQVVRRPPRANAEGLEAPSAASATTQFAHDFSRIPAHSQAPAGPQAKRAVNVRGDIYEQEADRVAEEVTRATTTQRQSACACGGECDECGKRNPPGLQTKLRINEPGDVYEQEADGTAERALASPAPSAAGVAPPTRRPSSGQSNGQLRGVPASVNQTLTSTGRSLEPALRHDMEQRFGHDFSNVRVHTDSQAAESAAAIGSRAYTSGHHVVFGSGEFQPASERGRRLLAHELTHVCQQASSSGFAGGFIGQSPAQIQRGEPDEETEEEVEEEEEEEELSAEGETSEEEFSEQSKDWIQEKYWGLQGKIGTAESLNQSDTRRQWLRRLAAEGDALGQIIESEEPVGILAVGPLSERLSKLEKEVEAENQTAFDLWERTNTRYGDERARLEEAGDYESELALGFLDQAFDQYASRIDPIIETDALVQDDILSLVYVLDNQTYMESARNVADRERKEAGEKLDTLSEEEEEGPGILETAWSIVGCDSVEECAGDVLLTVATGGAGKVAKWVVKGAKAVKKAKKAKKVTRSAKKLGKGLKKALSDAKSLEKFAGLVKSAAVDAATSYGSWLKKDWKKIAPKISTDLIANYTTGEGQTVGTVAVARINKEFVAAIVEKEFGVKKPDPNDIKVAIVLFLGKERRKAASLVRGYILQSLKFRTLVNVLFESLRAGTPLTEKDEIFRRVVISTVGECAQDTVQGIPFVAQSGLAKYLTEAMRKWVQQIFG